MRSFQSNPNVRRQIYLRLVGEIESQLRDAYDRLFQAKEATQSSLAEKLDVNRSAIHRRLMGRTNMTIETLADMVWVLGCAISVRIYDAQKDKTTNMEILEKKIEKNEVDSTNRTIDLKTFPSPEELRV